MTFGSKIARTMIANFVIGIGLQFGVFYSVAVFISGRDNRLITAAAMMAVYWGISLVLWMAGGVIDWATFFLWRKREMADNFLSTLKGDGYPQPGEYEDSAKSYFTRYMHDKNTDASVRVCAASTCGILDGISLCNRISLLAQVNMALEDAVARYKGEFPSRPKNDHA